MNRPNILFIVADDLNSWIEPLGRHPNVKTPNINKLASQGTIFTKAYCAAPYCNASRMSVFSGLLPINTGVYDNQPFWSQPFRQLTFPELLRSSGYYCIGSGKVLHGVFDYATATKNKIPHALWREIENRSHLWDAFNPNLTEPLPPNRPLNRMFDYENFKSVHPSNHHFDWGILPPELESDMPDAKTVMYVSDFLKNPTREPFFCAAGLYKPHLPWHVPKRFFDLYPIDEISLPLVKHDDLIDVPDIAKKWVGTPDDHRTILANNQWRHAVQAYLASISYCDSMIGEILSSLASSEVADNTVVILWGDNGFHLGEKLHWRKFVLWEEATRIPLIIAPNIIQKTVPRVNVPVSLIDIFPTICDLANLSTLNNCDGVSLTPLINGESGTRGSPVVMTWKEGNHSIISGDWRYTRYLDGGEELYDHQSDPFEWNNLIGSHNIENTLFELRMLWDRATLKKIA